MVRTSSTVISPQGSGIPTPQPARAAKKHAAATNRNKLLFINPPSCLTRQRTAPERANILKSPPQFGISTGNVALDRPNGQIIGIKKDTNRSEFVHGRNKTSEM